MQQVNVHEAKTHLSRLLERVATGEQIVISKAGKPVAKLVRFERQQAPRLKPGLLKGKIVISSDFDDPMSPEWLNAFYGK